MGGDMSGVCDDPQYVPTCSLEGHKPGDMSERIRDWSRSAIEAVVRDVLNNTPMGVYGEVVEDDRPGDIPNVPKSAKTPAKNGAENGTTVDKGIVACLVAGLWNGLLRDQSHVSSYTYTYLRDLAKAVGFNPESIPMSAPVRQKKLSPELIRSIAEDENPGGCEEDEDAVPDEPVRSPDALLRDLMYEQQRVDEDLFRALWEGYGIAPDEELTASGQALKQRLRAIVGMDADRLPAEPVRELVEHIGELLYGRHIVESWPECNCGLCSNYKRVREELQLQAGSGGSELRDAVRKLLLFINEKVGIEELESAGREGYEAFWNQYWLVSNLLSAQDPWSPDQRVEKGEECAPDDSELREAAGELVHALTKEPCTIFSDVPNLKARMDRLRILIDPHDSTEPVGYRAPVSMGPCD